MIQVLLFVKKIFHLEKYYSLDNLRSEAWNEHAFDLYHNDFTRFVDECIKCVESSIDDKFIQDESETMFPLKSADGVTNAIQDKLKEFESYNDDHRAKESIKNFFKHNLPDQIRSKNAQG